MDQNIVEENTASTSTDMYRIEDRITIDTFALEIAQPDEENNVYSHSTDF